LDQGISVLSLCGDDPRRELDGIAATWSPDGQWLAVAEPEAIVFHRMVGGPDQELRWPARAAQLAWSAG
jgi:hypothetical protein